MIGRAIVPKTVPTCKIVILCYIEIILVDSNMHMLGSSSVSECMQSPHCPFEIKKNNRSTQTYKLVLCKAVRDTAEKAPGGYRDGAVDIP